MLDRFERAIAVTEQAKADGQLTKKEIAWVLSAWGSVACATLEELMDPTTPVDNQALTEVLEAAWKRVEELLAGVPIPSSLDWIVRMARVAIAEALPTVAQRLGAWLDAGE